MTPEQEALLREADLHAKHPKMTSYDRALLIDLARELRAALRERDAEIPWDEIEKRAQVLWDIKDELARVKPVLDAATVCVAAHIDTHDGRLERTIRAYDEKG